MTARLPLKVLGLVGPVLGWVEGAEGLAFPEAWLARRLSAKQRETAWLVRELPTYSQDTVDEIILGARWESRHHGSRSHLPRHLRDDGGGRVAPPGDYDLGHVFRQLAGRYFEWRGTELTVQSQRMEELHELALRFPVAHLIRHLHAQAINHGFLSEDRARKLPERLSLLRTSSHGLHSVVSRGLAEGHLHLWGVLGGGETWADHLLKPLAPGILRGYEKEEERLFLLCRAALRLLAFATLQLRLDPEARPPVHLVGHLDELYFTSGDLQERLSRRRLREHLHEATLPASRESGAAAVLPRAMASRDPEVRGLLRLAHPLVDRLLQRQEPLRQGRKEGIRERLRLVDGLHLAVHRLLLEDPGVDGPEARGAQAPPDRTSPGHAFLRQVFFRYLVYQTHHWQLSTQSGRTTGLRYFKRYMEAPQRDTLDPDAVETQGLILERLRHAGHLRTVEGRISPPRGTDDLVPWILGYAEGADRRELEGFGLVVHFIKAERDEVEDPHLPGTRRRQRHGRVRRRIRQQAKELFLLLSRSHPAVPFIVGIDAANLELTTPPEVFAPAFRFLRDYPIEPRKPSSPWERFGAHAEVASLLGERRLGLTYHVGEDFRHIISGLRSIDEVLRFLQARPGDRLGHAIALGLDPEVWMRQNGFQAVVPKQEALDDLVWLLHFLGPGNDTVGELGIEDWIQRLSRELYGASALPNDLWLRDLEHRITAQERRPGAGGHRPTVAEDAAPAPRRPRLQWDWSPLTLHHAWLLRQLDPYLVDLPASLRGEPRLIDAPANSPIARRWIHVQQRVLRDLRQQGATTRSAFHLLSLYWLHRRVRSKGDELVNLDMHRDRRLWLRLCREVQEKLKQMVDEHQLIVEVNPSSNRLVGPMEKIGEHHVFAMSLDDEGKLDRRMRVTVNTDDPGVFNTSLPHEYYLLGEILLERGVSEPRVEEWLEWLRQNGEDASFTRCLPRADDPRVKKILKNLQRSRETVSERFTSGKALPGFWRRLRRGHRELSETAAARRDVRYGRWGEG